MTSSSLPPLERLITLEEIYVILIRQGTFASVCCLITSHHVTSARVNHGRGCGCQKCDFSTKPKKTKNNRKTETKKNGRAEKKTKHIYQKLEKKNQANKHEIQTTTTNHWRDDARKLEKEICAPSCVKHPSLYVLLY